MNEKKKTDMRASSSLLILQFSRDWTEPECDREYRKNTKLNKTEQIENISGQQLQEELDKIIRDYKEKKKIKTQQQNNENTLNKKFIINV